MVAVVLVLAGPSTISAVNKAKAGQRALEAAADAVRENDPDRADRQLTTARQDLTNASNALGSSWTWLARSTPLLGRQYSAASAILRSAELIATAGSGPLGVLRAQPGGFALRNGTLDLGALQRGAEALTNAAPAADEARREIERAPKGWLVPPLSNARTEAEREVLGAADAIIRGAAGLRAAPILLGADKPKRYIVLNSNLAELRGTGGILSYYALIQADRGRLTLLPDSGRTYVDLPTPAAVGIQAPKWYRDTWGRYAPLATWQNINMTTDFPTAADIMVKTASARLGRIDGAIQIDPYGLAALLQLSGPVAIQDWPEPITAENIAQVAQHDLYTVFSNNDARDAFGERLISTVFARFIAANIQPDLNNLQGLGSAVTDDHVKIYSTNGTAQKELATARIDGGLRHNGATDVLGVYNQNASGNKVDWFLKREISYVIRRGPDRDTRFGILTVTLRNESPSEGLPQYIIGPIREGFRSGENRTILTVVRPLGSRLLTVSAEGRSSLATIDKEKELRAHQLTVSIPPGGQRTIEMVFSLDSTVIKDYRLAVLHQPTVSADKCSFSVPEDSFLSEPKCAG